MNLLADAQQIETLAGGAVVVGFQALNLWRSVRNARNIAQLQGIVVGDNAEILSQLSAAKSILEKVMAVFDRRSPDSPKRTWANGGRRATDPPS